MRPVPSYGAGYGLDGGSEFGRKIVELPRRPADSWDHNVAIPAVSLARNSLPKLSEITVQKVVDAMEQAGSMTYWLIAGCISTAIRFTGINLPHTSVAAAMKIGLDLL